MDKDGRFAVLGEILFDTKAVAIGSNENDLWFHCKPMDIYSTQSKNQTANELFDSFVRLMFIKDDFLTDENYTGFYRKADTTVIELAGADLLKKIYFDNCSDEIVKIEIENSAEYIKQIFYRNDFKQLDPGCSVPTFIKTEFFKNGSLTAEIELKLHRIQKYNFSRTQRNIIFQPPQQPN